MDQIIEYPDSAVKVVKNVRIPMDDGRYLAGDLYAPRAAALDGSQQLPAVLEYTPYRKDDAAAPGPFRWYQALPANGYVVARVDCRGTGASEGVTPDEYTEREQRDGHDVVEWLAAQSWCNGHVAMIGLSYGGFTAVQVAALAPPHLSAIIPIYFTDDRYTDDTHYRGGLVRMWCDPIFYGLFMVAFNGLPPAPEPSLENWAEIWEEHLTGNTPWILKWLRHQTDGPYWRSGSVGDIADQIKCPVFMIGGWEDIYINPPFRLYGKLSVPRRLLMGPWDHTLPNFAVPGPRIDYLRDVIRWLDRYCKGIENGVEEEPAVIVYMQRFDTPDPDRLDTSGSWRADTEWPPPAQQERTFYLDADAGLADAPGRDGVDLLQYVPTVGVQAGLLSGGQVFPLAADQRPDEVFSLVYTSEPLAEELHLLGQPRLVLHVSSTASVLAFAASLNDVAPDDTSALISKGVLNATRRRSLTEPEPLRPDEVVELEIEIDHLGWVIEPGHRIRLAVANADFPDVWPTPELAQSKVFRGQSQVSRLVLPVVPAQGSAKMPELVPSPLAVSRRSASPSAPQFAVSRDTLTGRTKYEFAYGYVPGGAGRPTTFRGTCEVDPADPARAGAQGHYEFEKRWGSLSVAGRSGVVIQGTASHFHVVVDLEIEVNDSPHFAQRWAESIPRRLL